MSMRRQVVLDREFDAENLHAMAQIVIAKAYLKQDKPPKEIIPFLKDLSSLIPPDLKAHLDGVIPALQNGATLKGPCPFSKNVDLWPWDRVMDELHHYIWMYEYHDAMAHGDLQRAIRADQILRKIEQDQGNRYAAAMIHGPDLMDAFLASLSQSWLISGIWPESSNLVVIWGSYATYKSFLGIDIIVCLVAGIPYHGLETHKKRVVYLAAEGQAGIIRRVVGLMVHHGLDQLDGLTVLPMPCLIDDGQQLGELIAALKTMPEPPEIVVLDTLARSMAGDENETANMNKVVQACDQLRVEVGCRTMIIHHSGKDGARGSRGAISLPAATDTEIKIEKAGQHMARMICLKQKDYPEFEPRTYKLEVQDTGYVDDDLQPVTTLVPIYDPDATPPTDRPAISGATRIALDALTKAIDDQGQNPTSDMMQHMDAGAAMRGKVVHVDVWRDMAYKMGISSGEQKAKRTAFSRARQTLLDQGMISTWDGYYWVKNENEARHNEPF